MGLTLLGTLAGTVYALKATPIYRAETLLYPRESRGAGVLSAQLAQLSGFADLTGVGVGGGNRQEPMGLLRSKGFVTRFIVNNDLATSISPGASADNVHDAAEVFHRTVLSIFEDKRTGLITVGVKWRDPTVAAEWANAIVRQLNEEMRQRALKESEDNIRYLREQFEATTAVPLQESISRLLEAEMQKQMLARGAMDYSFRVLDAAEPPARPDWPKRPLIVAMSFSLSLFVSVFAVALAAPLRRVWVGTDAT